MNEQYGLILNSIFSWKQRYRSYCWRGCCWSCPSFCCSCNCTCILSEKEATGSFLRCSWLVINIFMELSSTLFIFNSLIFVFWFTAEEDPEVHLGQLKRFSLRELQVATDNFSNKNILGRGGFGKVYKGRLADGTLVAVKRLKEERTQGGELQFQTEVEMISMAVHRNLLRLRGFCMTPTERVLVYPYMANGSVASCLRG